VILLPDENFPLPVWRSLRRLGWDVDASRREAFYGKPDADVLTEAIRRGCVLLTTDGTFAAQDNVKPLLALSAGIVCIQQRLIVTPPPAQAAQRISSSLRMYEHVLEGRILYLEENGIRWEPDSP
jgi:predicted nuclease of predicted toxin-antitoxin system